jgi:hypothetical protein
MALSGNASRSTGNIRFNDNDTITDFFRDYGAETPSGDSLDIADILGAGITATADIVLSAGSTDVKVNLQTIEGNVVSDSSITLQGVLTAGATQAEADASTSGTSVANSADLNAALDTLLGALATDPDPNAV